MIAGKCQVDCPVRLLTDAFPVELMGMMGANGSERQNRNNRLALIFLDYNNHCCVHNLHEVHLNASSNVSSLYSPVCYQQGGGVNSSQERK